MHPRTGTPTAPDPTSWQRSWLDAYPCDRRGTLPYPQAPVSALLEHAARHFPDRPACTLFDKSVSYAQLHEQSRRLAGSLAKLGVGPGRFVGMLLPNVPEYLTALQATWLTGATALQLSPLLVAEEIDHWLARTGCHVVITLDLLAPLVMSSLHHGPLEHVVVASLAPHMALWKSWLYHVVRVQRNGSLRFRADGHRHHLGNLLAAEPLAKQPDLLPDDDVAVLAPTGGTTSSPKAVMLTHRNLLANAFQLRHYCGGEDGTEGVLGALPFFHAYGLSVSVLMTWAKAGTIHLHPRFDSKAVLGILERRHVELVPAVPAMLHALNLRLKRRPLDLSFIRSVVSGASALDPKVRAEFEQYGPRDVVEGYGLTEASPVTHVNPPGEGNRPGTIGVPLADTDARIVDPVSGTEELPEGAVGELVVRGPQVMKGYYQNLEETVRALRDGWLYTGDMARRDHGNYFTIVDRKKDIIKTSGFLVYPAEVEEVLRQFEAVAEAAVIGVPDAERGELVRALVVARPGKELSLAALENHCGRHLGKHKRPRQIDVVAELPKNFLGKVLRRKLREAPLSVGGDGQPAA